jgi:hypothetical protein
VAVSPRTRIGSFEITGPIGVGGMGEVYRATDTNLDETDCRLRPGRAFDSHASLCDTADMSETLTIRLAAEEKARWEKAAAAARESVAEYVRGAVRERTEAASQSPWERHLGSADVTVPAPTNENVRRAFARRSRRQR